MANDADPASQSARTGRPTFSAVTGFYRLDGQCRFVDLNYAAGRILGYSGQDLLGAVLWDAFPASADVLTRRVFERVLSTGVSETFDDDYPIAGEWLEVHVYPASGELWVFFRRITERKRAEQALHAERDLLELILAHLPDAVYVKDAAARFTRVNQAAATLFGLATPDAAIGLASSAVLPPGQAERFLAAEEALFDTGLSRIDELELHPDVQAGDRWFLTSTIPVRNRAGAVEGLVGIARDVTRLKEAELQTREALAAAEENSRIKSAFLAVMSHELRTPLNAILGYAHLLRDGYEGPLTTAQTEAVQRIVDGADRLLGLINDVLDLSRIEAGAVERDLAPVDLPRVVDLVRSALQPALDAKGLRLQVHLPPNLPELIADERHLFQVLTNLVGNAVKFTASGGVTIAATSPDPETLQLEVSDTGPGIERHELDHIFDAFRQADSSSTRAHGGVGLGLTISKRLVELHDGEIVVTSQPGVGSTFTVRLPLTARGLTEPAAGRDP